MHFQVWVGFWTFTTFHHLSNPPLPGLRRARRRLVQVLPVAFCVLPGISNTLVRFRGVGLRRIWVQGLGLETPSRLQDQEKGIVQPSGLQRLWGIVYDVNFQLVCAKRKVCSAGYFLSKTSSAGLSLAHMPQSPVILCGGFRKYGSYDLGF